MNLSASVMRMAEWIFWGSGFLIVYAYAGYPLTLWIAARLVRRARGSRAADDDRWPTVSMVVPVHNERRNIAAKLSNTAALEYPAGKLEILFVSDGSTDGTAEAIKTDRGSRVTLIELPTRQGKAAALNASLDRARNEIVVFTDASIILRPDAIQQIVRPFRDPRVGCVSGEDRIERGGGEALYGRYELFIRRQESNVHSLVGASGCLYAQRRSLCRPFLPGMAPDFMSVLETIDQGYLAVAEPSATGHMAAVDDVGGEFQRKVRTVLRGITTLGHYRRLLNPLRTGIFAWELWCHKVLRWFVPLFLAALIVANASLAATSEGYSFALVLQIGFYVLASLAFAGMPPFTAMLIPRVALFVAITNGAVVVAAFKYIAGIRQELWSPSRRACPTDLSTDA